MSRKKILTVTIKDCIVQTFRAGGPGGQNQNKRDTAVRIIHKPSGAVGESREERTQLQNKRKAWVRLGKSPKFQIWALKIEPIDVDSMLHPKDLLIEGRVNGQWTEI